MNGLAGLLFVYAALAAPSADHAFAPSVAKSDVEAGFFTIPQAQVEEYVSRLTQELILRTFEGQNEALKNTPDDRKGLIVGRGMSVGVGADEFLGDAASDGASYVFVGSVTSVDAEAVRLQVDLSNLADDEEVWVVDPASLRPFGPYGRSDNVGDGRWLPTIEGDTAIVLARSPRDTRPDVRLVAASHFFESFAELRKLLTCNIHVACETDATLQDISDAVGMMVVPADGDMAICSGTLLNNPDTPELEPYYLTSNHCVPEYIGARQVDIIWDYRAANCSGTGVPALSSLPRSSGTDLLVTSSSLDATLIKLDAAPEGTRGRTYAGWDTIAPDIGEDVSCMHYPEGSPMRISHGRVLALNVSSSYYGYQKQTKVVWDQGVTEGGSSGSALLYGPTGFKVIGTLSNGAYHTCGTDRSGNTDQYSSFRDFYDDTDAQLYLSGTNPPDPSAGGLCPAEKALQGQPEKLQDLRAFRDRVLWKSPGGLFAVATYYMAAPWLGEKVESSETVREWFVRIATPFEWVGSWLR